MMKTPQVVIDTNVIVAALRSRRGAAHKLLRMVDKGKFQINVSVPLVLEYEASAKRLIGDTALTAQDIDDVVDYLCSIANRQDIYYLWRPVSSDPKDDMVLELAVAAHCEIIVTFNKRDFREAGQFGVRVLTPREFLHHIGELS
jgi:putative PIN family toxin of toxin-antitoxin system